jgi:hypothetical protein
MSYRRGLQDGIAISQGKPLEPFKGPIKVIQEHKEQKIIKEKQDKQRQGILNILAYDGRPQEGEK